MVLRNEVNRKVQIYHQDNVDDIIGYIPKEYIEQHLQYRPIYNSSTEFIFVNKSFVQLKRYHTTAK